MAVRLTDIARKAGVSFQAVSAVVNNSKGTVAVSEKTRDRIQRIARELGYIPNAGARAIKRGRFNRIAWVTTRFVNQRERGWSNVLSYMDTAVDVLAERGYSLVSEPFNLDIRTGAFLEPPRLFCELAVDGLLALDGTGAVPGPVDELLRQRNAPLVWLNRNPVPGVSCVVCDEKVGAEALVRHLLDLGHRRIGYVGPRGVHYSLHDRRAGVLEALGAAGVDTRWAKPETVSGTLREAARRMLDLSPRPTGVICYSHVTFDAVMEEICTRGLRVPTDFSICYFGATWEMDVQLSATGVQLPEPRMAEVGVELLIDIIGGKRCDPVIRRVPGEFRSGRTTGPAPE